MAERDDPADVDVRGLPAPERSPRPWLDGYPRGVPADYDFPDVPLTRLLDDAARDFPELPAVRLLRGALDHATLVEQVDRCAAGLAELGVTPGARVASAVVQPAAAAVVAFATWRLGAALVLVDPNLHGPQLHDLLQASGATAIVTSHAHVVGVAVGVVAHVVLLRGREWLPWRQRVRAWRPRRRRRAGSPVDFSDLLAAKPLGHSVAVLGDAAGVVVPAPAGGDELVLSVSNLLAAAFQFRLWIPDVQAGQERLLSAHRPTTVDGVVRGLLFPVLSGASADVTDGSEHAFLDALRAEPPTLIVAEGRAVGWLAAQARRDGAPLRSVRAVIVTPGGATDRDARAVESGTGARVRVGMGPAAACGFTHAAPVYASGLAWARPVPVTATRAVVIAADGRSVEDGAEAWAEDGVDDGASGRLVVAGPQVASHGWHVSDLVVGCGPGGALLSIGEDGVDERR